MSVVEQYWSGVLRRLEAEVHGFNELIGHMGEKGRENELSLSRLLEKLVPTRYGVGSGLLIDSEGHQSKQMDIVIYDQIDEPAILAQTNQVLFPVENVRACIEVKTTASQRQIADAGEKHASILELSSRTGRSPVFALVAYSAGQEAKTLAKHLIELPPDARPHLACVLEMGLVAAQGAQATDLGHEVEYMVGAAPLQNEDAGGRLVGDYVLPDDDGAVAQLIGGNTYPVVTLESGEILAEPSRALLLFCEALLAAIARLEGREPPAFRYYINDAARDLMVLEQVVKS